MNTFTPVHDISWKHQIFKFTKTTRKFDWRGLCKYKTETLHSLQRLALGAVSYIRSYICAIPYTIQTGFCRRITLHRKNFQRPNLLWLGANPANKFKINSSTRTWASIVIHDQVYPFTLKKFTPGPLLSVISSSSSPLGMHNVSQI